MRTTSGEVRGVGIQDGRQLDLEGPKNLSKGHWTLLAPHLDDRNAKPIEAETQTSSLLGKGKLLRISA